MTVFIRPEFTPGTLPTFTGYHLQIFGAGRAKISLQQANNKKIEFYTALPKRDREGLRRQRVRSLAALPDHYARIDRLLSEHPDIKVFRLYAKGDTNATADNAHLLASLDQATLWLVMSGVVHRWDLTTLLVQVLLEGKGKRTGEASIFNEYVPSYDHDWEDAEFAMADYAKGLREGPASSVLPKALTANTARPSKAAPPPSPAVPQPTPKAKQRVTPTTLETDYISDDPASDPIFLAELPHDPPEATFPGEQDTQSWQTKTQGRTTLYATDDLRAQLGM